MDEPIDAAADEPTNLDSAPADAGPSDDGGAVSLEGPDREAMHAQIGASLELHLMGQEVAFAGRLDVSEDLEPTPGTPRTDPFRLVVSLEPGLQAVEGLYLVTGADLEEEPIFWVPIGPDADGREQLEAIFN